MPSSLLPLIIRIRKGKLNKDYWAAPLFVCQLRSLRLYKLLLGSGCLYLLRPQIEISTTAKANISKKKKRAVGVSFGFSASRKLALAHRLQLVVSTLPVYFCHACHLEPTSPTRFDISKRLSALCLDLRHLLLVRVYVVPHLTLPACSLPLVTPYSLATTSPCSSTSDFLALRFFCCRPVLQASSLIPLAPSPVGRHLGSGARITSSLLLSASICFAFSGSLIHSLTHSLSLSFSLSLSLSLSHTLSLVLCAFPFKSQAPTSYLSLTDVSLVSLAFTFQSLPHDAPVCFPPVFCYRPPCMSYYLFLDFPISKPL